MHVAPKCFELTESASTYRSAGDLLNQLAFAEFASGTYSAFL